MLGQFLLTHKAAGPPPFGQTNFSQQTLGIARIPASPQGYMNSRPNYGALNSFQGLNVRFYPFFQMEAGDSHFVGERSCRVPCRLPVRRLHATTPELRVPQRQGLTSPGTLIPGWGLATPRRHASATGGSYTWTPSSSLVDGDYYALQINQGSDINYTNLFSISGGSGSAIPSTDSATLSATPYSSTFATSTTIQLTTGVTTSHISRGTSLSISRNATISTPALSSTRAVTLTPTAAPTESEPSAPTSTPNAAPAILSRPVALALGGLAAFVYLN
uniref:Extracellular matrix protein n=1 Tax=Coccidioides posadasii RMSCC 3488 TaxID=454284 RepID=A0A0J6FHK6_COCPO|nr:extracellular matrix protein [Coccidioides posadasii RMSCC 3488]